METSDLHITEMNLGVLREFAEERGISTKIAGRLWYALAREALSQSDYHPNKQTLSYDQRSETLYFYRNPQEYAEQLRNVGRVSLNLLDQYMDIHTEKMA